MRLNGLPGCAAKLRVPDEFAGRKRDVPTAGPCTRFRERVSAADGSCHFRALASTDRGRHHLRPRPQGGSRRWAAEGRVTAGSNCSVTGRRCGITRSHFPLARGWQERRARGLADAGSASRQSVCRPHGRERATRQHLSASPSAGLVLSWDCGLICCRCWPGCLGDGPCGHARDGCRRMDPGGRGVTQAE